jgi:allophanate hydrolase
MTRQLPELSLDLATLREFFSGGGSPRALIGEVYRRIGQRDASGVWTALTPAEEALARADALARVGPAGLPLYGVPFSVKDNIHVAGLPTTAGCPAFSHWPEASATVVRKLEEAGAILIGKNTMDQFATGLVGIRSPARPINLFDRSRIPGGSSSGSAVAVAAGLVSIALGSDTGGSGRVPAALNNIVGFKPTPGIISTNGMIYANRSFDCVPVFALNCGDASEVFEILIGEDGDDPFMRENPRAARSLPGAETSLTIAAPDLAGLGLDGDDMLVTCFREAVGRFQSLGAKVVPLDWSPFAEAGAMVFDGPILAERLASVGGFIAAHRPEVHPIVGRVVEKAAGYSAVDLIGAQHRLRSLQAEVERRLSEVDALLTPTVPWIPTIAEVEADPVTANNRMGRFTYFANPLELSAVALPSAIRPDGLPFGICLYARKRSDAALLRLATRYERLAALRPGAPVAAQA